MSSETIHRSVKRHAVLQQWCYIFKKYTPLWKIRDVSNPIFESNFGHNHLLSGFKPCFSTTFDIERCKYVAMNGVPREVQKIKSYSCQFSARSYTSNSFVLWLFMASLARGGR